jgi:hypothetical protein
MPCNKYKGKQKKLCVTTKEWTDWSKIRKKVKIKKKNKLLPLLLLLLVIPSVLALISYTGSVNVIVDDNLDGAHDVAVADMDSDGDIDIVADAYRNYSVILYEQIDEDTWTKHVVDDNLTNAHDIQIMDVNGDGVPDIIGGALSANYSNYSQQNASLRWYNGSGSTWTNNLIESSTFVGINNGLIGLRGLSPFDMNSDGVEDIIVAIDQNTLTQTGALYLYINPNGTNSSNASLWEKIVVSTSVSNLAYAEAGDVDEDGNPDIVTNEHHPENDGMTHIFFAPYDISDVGNWTNITLSQNTSWHSDIVDFDGDGFLDILVSHWKHNKYSWYKNPALDYHWVHVDSEKKYGYLDIQNSETLNQSFDEMAIEIWFRPLLTNFSGTENQWSRLIHKTPYQLAPNGANKYILFQWQNTTGQYTSFTSDVQEWEVGNWYQCIININSSNDVIMYINGVKQSSTGTVGGLLSQTSDSLRIGDDDTPDRAFNGSIGKVKIWNSSLTDSEISQAYSTGRGQDNILTDNLVLYLSMKGGNDSSIADLSGLGNNATMVGAKRNNSIRNISAWTETIIDEQKDWTNGSMSIEAFDIDGDGDLDIGVNTIPNVAIGSKGYYMWYERTNDAGTLFTRHLIDDNISRTSWAHDMTLEDINDDGYGDMVGASASANMTVLYYSQFTEDCTQYEGVFYPILQLLAALIIPLSIYLFIRPRDELGWGENVRLIDIFLMFLIIMLSVAFIEVIGNTMAVRCVI